MPPGWTVTDDAPNPTGEVWAFNDPGGRGNLTGGTGAFAVLDSDHLGFGHTQDSSLITPAMNLSTAGTPVVRFTTKAIDRSQLPVDGVMHEGRYFVLAAESPIAFATGTVRLATATGRLLSDARVIAAPLGVADLTRIEGIYNVPVPAVYQEQRS